MNQSICPKCGQPIKGYPAISREDNKTEICSQCGVQEAMQVFEAAKKQQHLNFIKAFSNISISKICRDNHINRSNILNGKASPETTKVLFDKIIEELQEITKNLQF